MDIIDVLLPLIVSELIASFDDGKPVVSLRINVPHGKQNESASRRHTSWRSDEMAAGTGALKIWVYISKLYKSYKQVMKLLIEEESIVGLMQNITEEWRKV